MPWSTGLGNKVINMLESHLRFIFHRECQQPSQAMENGVSADSGTGGSQISAVGFMWWWQALSWGRGGRT